jgi:TPR repeat protein
MRNRDINTSTFNEYLDNTLQGDWQARNRLNYYFGLDQWLSKPPSIEKKQQIKSCFERVLSNANNGNPFAIAYLGYLHQEGLGGAPKNLPEAVKRYRDAAERHQNPWGQCYLANCYRDGIGVKPNAQYAQGLYELAVKQEYPDALYNLALFHEKSPKHKEKSKALLAQALACGHPSALNRACLGDKRINPFELYMPKNKEIYCTYKARYRAANVVDGYKVTVSYKGNVKGIDVIHTANIDESCYLDEEEIKALAANEAKYSTAKLCGLVFCTPIMVFALCVANCSAESSVTWTRDDADLSNKLAEIAASWALIELEEKLAEVIEQADELLTKKLKTKESSREKGDNAKPEKGNNLADSDERKEHNRLLKEQNDLIREMLRRNPGQMPLGQPEAPLHVPGMVPPPQYSSSPPPYNYSSQSYGNFFPSPSAPLMGASFMSAPDAVAMQDKKSTELGKR